MNRCPGGAIFPEQDTSVSLQGVSVLMDMLMPWGHVEVEAQGQFQIGGRPPGLLWRRQGHLAQGAGAPGQKTLVCWPDQGSQFRVWKYGPLSWGRLEDFAGRSSEERWGGTETRSGELWTTEQ